MINEKELSDKIIGCALEVYNNLESGYLEKVYENAMLIELKAKELKAEPQVPINVLYKEEIVGQYYSDIIVEDKIILELKSCTDIHDSHIAQLINYLTATDIKGSLKK
jgi:GxxExxY protein